MDDELLQGFIDESREHLETIESDLLTIEEHGANIDSDLVNKVFRAAHSIKGGSGFFGLTRIKELAHPAETVLDMIRSKKLTPNPEIVNILLQTFDQLREMINNHQTSNQADITAQVVALTGLTSAYLPPAEKSSLTHDIEFTVSGIPHSIRIPEIDVNRAVKTGQYIYAVQFDLIHDIERKNKTPWAVIKQLIAVGSILDAAVDFEAVGTLDGPAMNAIPLLVVHATVVDPSIAETLYHVEEKQIHLLNDPHSPMTGKKVPATGVLAAALQMPPVKTTPSIPIETPSMPDIPIPLQPVVPVVSPVAARPLETEIMNEVMVDHEVPVAAAAVNGTETIKSTARVKAEGKGQPAAESSLRVNVALLESLMNLAGELVLGRNQLREALSRTDTHAVSVSSQRISAVTSELQEAIMQTRMQPIGNLFNKFPRVVRDMSRDLKKDITLELQGSDVEMDKTLIEGLSDPLTHMVRNAVDHGIELPEVRMRAGKPAQGTVTLRAYHEAGSVVVEIIDDGKGLDPQKIAVSAIKKGLLTQDSVNAMSEKDKMALIFLPGLSTADKVTDVSGRGVGMDVVKTNMDRLGGKIDIESKVGRGSVFRIKLPLTLAIIPSLIVTVSDDRFAIPQVNLRELIRVTAAQHSERIGVVGDAKVLLLRGEMIPIVDFSALLNGTPAMSDLQKDLCMAVVSTGTLQYALIVDGFINTEEIVVKALGRHLKGLHEYAGATIMGDGKVALILDAGGLATKAGLTAVAASAETHATAQLSTAATKITAGQLTSLFLFQNGPSETCAVPLNMIRRVERIQASQVEMIGGRRTMQYRGGSLPLVTLKDAIAVNQISDSQELVVIVFTLGEREVGLLAAMPVDVVETTVAIDNTTLQQRGVSGSAIIHDKTVLMINLPELVGVVYPDWAPHVQAELVKHDAKKLPVILLAEDSDFFRTQERRIIEAEGYKVIDAPDGEAAWELLQSNADLVRMVITDVEMPRLTGLQLVERMRAEPRFAHIPVIALSSLAGEEDIQRGKSAGMTEYQVKLDPEKLLEGMRHFLNG